jgi:natural product biosynthesis luciferase-like monooxygenase protein
VDIGIGFFSSNCGRHVPFELFTRVSKMADAMGLASVWIPERHYNPFGGAFPCPAVAAGALAAATKRIQIRAGSVVSPLHDAIEVAEQWAMVHALSKGRAGIAVASGWKSDDFVTRPENYSKRKELIWAQIDEILALWRGESVTRVSPTGDLKKVAIYPMVELPAPGIWIATSGDQETLRRAGASGAGIYTHLVAQSIAGLKKTIQTYRSALPASVSGNVALLIHTYIAESDELAQSRAHGPLENYLRQFIELNSGPLGTDCEANIENRLKIGITRYFKGHSLIGSCETCHSVLRSLAAIDVDEVVCLIDFGLDDGIVMQSIQRIERLRDLNLLAKHQVDNEQ